VARTLSRFGAQLDRLSSLGLRPVPRRVFYLPGVAGRGLGRPLDIAAALIEPERRVAVGQRITVQEAVVNGPRDG
jgi:hypothetical protein